MGGKMVWVESKVSEEEWGLSWSYTNRVVNEGIACGLERSF